MQSKSVMVGVLMAAIAGLTMGCDAFSNAPTELNAMNSVGAYDLIAQQEREEAGGAPAPAPKVMACKAVDHVTVAVSEKPSISANSGWAANGKVTATAVDESMANIEIAGNDGTVKLTVQQVGDKQYAVCGVGFTKANEAATEYEVTGTVMVDQFSAQSTDGKAINAGAYALVAKPKVSEGTAKVAALLLATAAPTPAPSGATSEDTGAPVGDGSLPLEGTYYTESVEVAASAAQ